MIDSYSTPTLRFREIACVGAGARATTVVIAAAPTGGWTRQSAVLERSIASFAT